MYISFSFSGEIGYLTRVENNVSILLNKDKKPCPFFAPQAKTKMTTYFLFLEQKQKNRKN